MKKTAFGLRGRMWLMIVLPAYLALSLMHPQPAGAAWREAGYAVPSREGVKLTFVLASAVRATGPGQAGAGQAASSAGDSASVPHLLVYFTGGAGGIGPPADGLRELEIGSGVSLRGFMAEKLGMAVAIGLPSDQTAGLSLEWRESKQHVEDVGAAMAVLMAKYPAAKVTLLGISNGARSATHIGAAYARAWGDRLQGVVVMSASGEAFREDWIDTLMGKSTAADANRRKVPLLVVHHKRDSCLLYRDIENQARWHAFLTVDDVKQPRPNAIRRDCDNGSAHQFGGKEEMVYQAVVDWIKTGNLPAMQ